MKVLKALGDALKASAITVASLIACGFIVEPLQTKGIFTMEHIRDGKVIYSESFPNTVVTVGKNLMLDSALAGSVYTVTGPFMGLISSVSFSAISASDTMASHAGWLEAGNANAPTYGAPGPRATAAWSSASGGSKSLSAALSFAITGTGTLEGAFLVYGSGATSVIAATTGTLFSAGLFTGGTRSVINGDTVNVSYSVSI